MEQLEKYFDTAFGAPDGIKKLRELILTLSFQGELTPRQTKGQSVSELLQSIESEKSKLIKTNKIKVKNISNSNEINADLYEIPKGWKWVRLRDISYDLGQKSPSSRFTYIDVGSVDNSAGMITDKVQILDSNEAPSRARKIVKEGTVIYSTVRPYLLNIAIVGREYKPEPIASTAFAILHPYTGINNRYLYFYLRSPVFISFVEKLMKGVAYPAINDGDLFSGFIPLPPSKEQDQIVDKIDQLMSRCDVLEKLGAERHQKRLDVHTIAIRKLLDAPDQGTFDDAWQFILRHFGGLYTVRENVAELRKAILQLAVMGKLVPQDAKEGTARELLEEIKREKRKHSFNGKLKANKTSQESRSYDDSFTIPSQWKWVRLRDIMLKITDGTHHSPPNSATGEYLYISAKNIKNEGVQTSNATYVSQAIHKEIYSRCNPEPGDILYIKDGATTGIVTINNLSEPFSMLSSVALLKQPKQINNRFLLYALRSPFYYDQMRSAMSGVAITRVTLKILNDALLPLPPLAEQNRIVMKIEKLLDQCNGLEKQINMKFNNQATLLQSLIDNPI